MDPEILSKPYTRRAFYWTSAAITIALVLIRMFLVPLFKAHMADELFNTVTDLNDNLIVSLLVTIWVGTYVFYLTPQVVRQAKVSVIAPREIGPYLEVAMQTSEIWLYRGGTGRYFRSTTLPNNARYARSTNHQRQLMAVIIDPDNMDTVQHYYDYRRGVEPAGNEQWSTRAVRKQLFATIISSCIAVAEEPRLRIRMAVSKQMSLFRIDMSNKYVIITKEGRRDPAIRADEGTFFYDAYKDEFHLTFEQAREITLVPLARMNLTHPQVTNAIHEMGFNLGDLTEDDLHEILSMGLNPINPYA